MNRLLIFVAIFGMALSGCGESNDSGGGSDEETPPPQAQSAISAICDGGGLPKICLSESTVMLKMGDDFVAQGVAIGGDGSDISAQVVISEISTSAVFRNRSSDPELLTHSAVPKETFYFGTQPLVTFRVTDSEGNVATATQKVKYYNTPEETPIQKFSGTLSTSVIEWRNGAPDSFNSEQKVILFFKIDGVNITLINMPDWQPDVAAIMDANFGPDAFIILPQRTPGVVYGPATKGQLDAKILGKGRYIKGRDEIIIDFTAKQNTGPNTLGINTRQSRFVGTLSLVLPLPTDKDPNLIDNGDGTISDKETLLMWVDPAVVRQNRDMSGNWYQAIGVRHDTLNNGTVVRSICGDLDFAGHTDWKVPGRGQLGTLIHPFNLGFIDTSLFDYFFTSWSRDSRTNQVAWAYQVSFVTGLTTESRRENSRFILCVRDQ